MLCVNAYLIEVSYSVGFLCFFGLKTHMRAKFLTRTSKWSKLVIWFLNWILRALISSLSSSFIRLNKHVLNISLKNESKYMYANSLPFDANAQQRPTCHHHLLLRISSVVSSVDSPSNSVLLLTLVEPTSCASC